MGSNATLNEDEVYSQIKSLANYLKTEVEVTTGIIEMRVKISDSFGSKWVAKEAEGHNVRVVIRNAAPSENSWPLIVFTGLGLMLEHPHISLKKMRSEQNLKVDLSNAPQSGTISKHGFDREDELDYPDLTDAERKQGHALFPGQSIKYELKVASKRCPDVNDLKIKIEGNISRRHLFHFMKELEVKQN